jgi:hypothetical protein
MKRAWVSCRGGRCCCSGRCLLHENGPRTYRSTVARGNERHGTFQSWRVATHPIRLFGGANANQPSAPWPGRRPIVANGVILTLSDAAGAEINVNTAQGNFTVPLRDIPYGKSIKALNGRVMVERVPAAAQLTSSPEEQDYPAACADKSGNVWIAYLEFKHHPDHNGLRAVG